MPMRPTARCFANSSSERQLQRLCARDGLDEQAARQRIDAQLSMAVKCARADYIIDNDGTLEELHAKIDRLMLRLRPWPVWTWLCWLAPVGVLAAGLQLVWRWLAQPAKTKIE
ncbi:hypothetical protein THASP1DRAFT_31654 [Thamnocephalis sphaerospora]|uniref:Dephospho-CoA kinase n=1 Tax=Thamnocephalis sphaerospora TaxID=78915 RepID=A0A4P9XL12_9FUNG|nr:hypothetical protein THASP1DRAFT_31654 [Thamnocephalis sphaerospora]|eukprot:RKP06524.1 hypothetical protein THASP1DRAFT_31654 [Thamnocephalis sphaerospora]